jgi:hypothetical protein
MLGYLIQLCYVSLHVTMLSGTPDSSAKFTQRSNKDEAQLDDKILANTATTGVEIFHLQILHHPGPMGENF